MRLLTINPFCNYCGLFLHDRNSTLDHVLARYWGGSDSIGNLALACKSCNRIKDDNPVESLACPVVRGGQLRFVFQVLQERKCVMSKVSFNYAALVESQQKIAKESAARIHELVTMTATSIIEIGKLLVRVHGILRDEAYHEWLLVEFGWTYRAAWHYESAAKRFGDVDETTLSRFMPGALRILSNGQAKPEAAKEAVKIAAKGRVVTKKEAVSLIRKHAPVAQHHEMTVQHSVRRFRSAITLLLTLPLEQRRQLADELVDLAERLRQADPQPKAIAGTVREEAGTAEPRRGRRRELVPA